MRDASILLGSDGIWDAWDDADLARTLQSGSVPAAPAPGPVSTIRLGVQSLTRAVALFGDHGFDDMTLVVVPVADHHDGHDHAVHVTAELELPPADVVPLSRSASSGPGCTRHDPGRLLHNRWRWPLNNRR